MDWDTLEHIEQLTDTSPKQPAVDAYELVEGDAPFIADTSAWWRFSSFPAELAAEAEHGGGALLYRDTHFDKLAEDAASHRRGARNSSAAGVCRA